MLINSKIQDKDRGLCCVWHGGSKEVFCLLTKMLVFICICNMVFNRNMTFTIFLAMLKFNKMYANLGKTKMSYIHGVKW